MLHHVGLDDADLAWLTRFGQSGRMTLTQNRFRITSVPTSLNEASVIG
jgi:hypothetical protein